MISDEPIDQSKLPWASIFGEPSERTLAATEFEAWAALRAVKCGHRDQLLPVCRWCRGVLKVADLLATGAELVRLFPAR